MIKSIVKLGLLLFIGILGYNYFLGDAEEKQQSKEIFNSVTKAGGSIFKSVTNLLKDENKKFKAGKYDHALEKVGNILENAREKASRTKNSVENILDNLADRKQKLEKALGIELKKDIKDENKLKELSEEFESITRDLTKAIRKNDLE